MPFKGSDRQLRHVHEVLELLQLISADNTFTNLESKLLYNEHGQGGVTMYNMVQAIRQEGFINGERQGFTNGEQQGFTNGERQGRDSLYALLSALQAEGKNEVLARVLSDRSYMEQLLEKKQS